MAGRTGVVVVYPLSSPEAVKRLFARYDHGFAAALGVPLRAGRHAVDEYSVAEIISSKWWDDGAWMSGFAPSSAPAGSGRSVTAPGRA